ncbi:hypothetical protein RB195_000843 [Necator americanus]|uniref:Pao retrotransposon peptidase n=1 Tax=Necator americanus TaxID=51031 RepID=A0ABR1DDA8_NECAM
MSSITKRTVTSAISAIYDPLGWQIPLLHKIKIFLQDLWKNQYDWDVRLRDTKVEEWKGITAQISGFEKDLPCFLQEKKGEVILVTFADASTNTMAACTCLHSNTSAQLLMAKSKLPSLQCHYTIPKLEPNRLALAMRLTNSVFSQLKPVINIKGVYVFSDSEIVLSWLKIKPEKEVGQFVSNRLIEIRNITNHMTEQGCFVRFGYVSSQDNPADCATRGLNKDELVLHFWWTGPNFIYFPSRKWLNQGKFLRLMKTIKLIGMRMKTQ